MRRVIGQAARGIGRLLRGLGFLLALPVLALPVLAVLAVSRLGVQASREVGRSLHRLSRLAVLLAVLVAGGGAALAWRLDQGPLDLPWLRDELVLIANRTIAPLRLEIGATALVWEGFRHGVDRPIDLRASDLTVFDSEGRRVAQAPEVYVSLSLRALLGGHIAPRGLLVQGARVRAVRNRDGSMAVDFSDGTAAAAADTVVKPADFAWVFEALAQPPGTDLGGRATLLSQLRELRLRDTRIVVRDDALGIVWQAPKVELNITRLAGGGAEGTAALELLVGERALVATARLGLPAHRQDSAKVAPELEVQATLASVVPADFATLAPAFASLAAVAAPVTLTGTAQLGADLVVRHGWMQMRMAGGTLRIARGEIPVSDALADIEGTAESLRLTLHRLALPGSRGAPTIVTGTATLAPQAGMLAGTLDLRLDEVGFADLAALWPDGVGGPGAKPWITGNITAGVARDLRLSLRVIAAPDLSDGAVTALTGSLEGRDMVVHWLRPVPPAEGVAARLAFLSPDEIEITVLAGRQDGLVLEGGRVALTGLARRDQYVNIALDLGGPVADLLAILNHPRVNLLSRRPIAMRNPSGRVEGTLVVTALPLENDLTLEDVRLSSVGRLSRLNLGGIVAGRDLADGTLTFEAGNDGLQLRGAATVAGIPAQLAVEMDFTDGPASQVIQKVSASGTADAAWLVAQGLDTRELVMDGTAALKLDLVARRGGRSQLTVRADLANMGLRADRLNWGKPAGRPAEADALVVLDRGRLADIPRLRLVGEGVAVQGTLEVSGGAPRRLNLARLVLAPDTDIAADILWPRAEGQPWVIRASGSSVDISGEMARQEPPGEPAPRGPPWNAELRADRVVLGPGRVLTGVQARSDNDGLITRTARITGRAGAGPFELSILSSGAPPRRGLTITAQDAGALLRALDVLDDLRDGQLTVNAHYDDSRPDHPLSGIAEMAEFGVHNAPAFGKLLQAITVVGAIEALNGPDLRFTRMVAPFRYAERVIDLVDARVYSASLGMTAKGRIDVGRRLYDLQGTVVPAYFLNSLLGRVPLLGKLVSPETGGGLFAMSFGMKGPFDDASVWVNPLSAVTPGFLRGLFGVFEGPPGGGSDASPAPPARAPPARAPAMREGGQR